MGLAYIVDTNIVSEIMRPKPNEVVLAKWQQHYTEIGITAVTWHELLTGVNLMSESKRRSAFEAFLFHSIQKVLPILPYDYDSAQWHAYERARLTQLGHKPAFPDGQIAAIAVVNDLTLISRNVSDFVEFAELKIENWFDTTHK
jgi:tRNA(fMet)-specific endonuclease VapC